MFGNRRIRELEDEVRLLSIKVADISRIVDRGYYAETGKFPGYRRIEIPDIIELILKQLNLKIVYTCTEEHSELVPTGKTKKG
jgi:hypothetical protein